MYARIAVIAVLLLGLSACAQSAPSLSLLDTKSPVQLLRNEAWFRLPAVMVKGDSEVTDVSVACNDDPKGRLRYWTSSTVALVNNSFAPRVTGVADNLVASFVEQGWTATRTEESGAVLTALEKVDTVAKMEIESVEKTSEHRATVRISVTGPCVRTDGPDSDEVRMLTPKDEPGSGATSQPG